MLIVMDVFVSSYGVINPVGTLLSSIDRSCYIIPFEIPTPPGFKDSVEVFEWFITMRMNCLQVLYCSEQKPGTEYTA